MSTVADRLNRALTAANQKQSDFQRAVAEYDVRGASKPSVNDYIHGRVVPPLEFLEVASEVLGVRPEWLAFGTGERTPEEEEKVRGRRGPGVDLPLTRVIRGVFEEVFPPFNRLNLMHQWTVWDVWTFLLRTRRARGEVTEEGRDVHDADGLAEDDPAHPQWAAQVAAARSVGRALQAPFDAMGIDPDDVGPLELHRYVETACSAMLFLVDQDELRRSVALGARTRVTIE